MNRKLLLIILAVLILSTFSTVSFGRDYKRGKDDNPVRILAYVVHPVGMAAEYLITRPIHWVVKQTDLNKVFGSEHKPEDVSFVWE
jgi:hypothetical protein